MTILETIATLFAVIVIVGFVIGAYSEIADYLGLTNGADVLRELLGGYTLAVVLYVERRWVRD